MQTLLHDLNSSILDISGGELEGSSGGNGGLVQSQIVSSSQDVKYSFSAGKKISYTYLSFSILQFVFFGWIFLVKEILVLIDWFLL